MIVTFLLLILSYGVNREILLNHIYLENIKNMFKIILCLIYITKLFY